MLIYGQGVVSGFIYHFYSRFYILLHRSSLVANTVLLTTSAQHLSKYRWTPPPHHLCGCRVHLCFHWPLSLLWDDGSCLSLVLEFSITSKTILISDSWLDYGLYFGLDFGMDSRTYELTSRFQAFPQSSLWSLPALSQRLQLHGAYRWQHFRPRQCISLTHCLVLSYGEIAIVFHNTWWVYLLCTVILPPQTHNSSAGDPIWKL